MTKLGIICIAFAATAVLSVSSMDAQVRVYEGTLSLPAYEEGLPNPNPPFDEYATTRFNYPYTLRDNITSRRAVHAFRAVYLENEYLKCSVLPDLGGHIYTCVDKINNVPMFYANPSIKEAQIGMRGGWAAYGEEFNFPVSHSWTTMTPVDYSFASQPDGSGSVTVSNIDRVYGMQWTVQIVLRPGTTLLEQHVTLNNRSDVRHRFYWWSNAGIQVWDDSRICYPMQYSAAHGFADVDRWPIDSSGTDRSILKNQIDGPESRFVHGSREPYMGIWNPHTNAGVVHYSEYDELPAKKIWSWGVDADGLDWRHALSDNNSAYMEVQAGLFLNQETYAFLAPRQTLKFSEYWMPTRELGGLARANLAAAANLSRDGNSLTLALNVNRRYPGAQVRLLDGDAVLQTFKADLAPEKTWKQQIQMSDVSHHYTLEVRDTAGTVLLAQTEGKYDWAPDSDIHLGPQQGWAAPAPAQRSSGDWLQLGRNDELNGRLLVATSTYRDGLKSFPHDQQLTIAAGRLAVQLLRYDEAIPFLTAAQDRDTPDSEIAYYLGLAYDGVQDARHARIAYETATRLPEMRAAAYMRLAEMDAQNNDLPTAVKLLRLALKDAPEDLRTAEELVAVLHASGHADTAHALATDWSKRYPTSTFLAEELGSPQINHLAAAPERVLNVAAEYMRLGRYEQAVAVLSRDYPKVPAEQREPGSVAPQDSALVGYYKAFCLRHLGRSADEAQAAASRLPVLYMFPSGATTDEVLRAALQKNPNDATAEYLLGMLQFSVGLTRSAEARWDHAHAIDARLKGLDANRGLAALSVDLDPEKALAAFREGIQNDPTNEALYTGVDRAISLLHRAPIEFIHATDSFPDKKDMRAKLVYELAARYVEVGDFSAAEALFRDRFFPREEGGTNVREVWIEVELEHSTALANAGKCEDALHRLTLLGQPEPGLSFTADGMEPLLSIARVQYKIAAINRTCHNENATRVALTRAAAGTRPEDIPWANKAAQQLPGYDPDAWHLRMVTALQQSRTAADAHPFSTYSAGLLEQQLGLNDEANATFRHVFLLPDDRLSYHLTRMAQQERPSK